MNDVAIQQSSCGNLRELSLFAGCGGGILAAKLLGWRTVCAVEIEPYRAERLAQRQNEGFLSPFPIWCGDIAAFDGRPWRGIVDVVSGGFPCQDISAANPNAEGITGARSGLWKEQFRILCEIGHEIEPAKKPLLFMENSPALTGRGLGVVLGDLAALGYDAQWGVLGADDLGGFHRRERIFLVGYPRDYEQLQSQRHFGNERQRIGNPSKDCELADFSEGRCGSSNRREMEQPGRTEIECSGDIDELGHADRARLQGQSGDGNGTGRSQTVGYTSQTNIRDVADSNSERRRAEHEQQISQGTGTREQSSGRGEDVAGKHECSNEKGNGTVGDVLWGTIEIIECRDGKYRATKPGLCGVAHGVANRVDRVSAVGDGQVPCVVAAAWNILKPIAKSPKPDV